LTQAVGLAKMSKLEEKRNKKHTYLELKVMIPTGQGTMEQKSENAIRKIFRKDANFNFMFEQSEDELWQGDPAETEPDPGQGDLKVE
jgi:hypothetical protein